MKKNIVFTLIGLTVAAAAAGADYLAANIVKSSVDINASSKGNTPVPDDSSYEDYPGIEDVSIKSFDLTPLAGHWYPCEDAKRTLICVHGWRGSWCRDFNDIIGFLHDNGCNLLLVDQRGQQGSGGKYMGFGLLERYDCLEWAKWVDQRTPDDMPIYLYGVSMGSTSVLMASALDLPANVKGIIADCGFTSAQDEWRHIARRLRIPYSFIMEMLTERHFARITGAKGTDYSTEDALKECSIPVLFVHGGKDHFVPTEMTPRNYEAFEGSKEMLIVDGAKHGKSYKTDPDAYEAAVRRLWDKCEES